VVDIFDEVDEELRADKAQAFLHRYGGLVIAGAIAIVVGVGAYKAWRWYDTRSAMAVADQYAAAERAAAGASEAAGRDAAMADFAKIATSGRGGYRTAALLNEAALAVNGGDLTRASALWDQVAGDSGADPLLRDLANLLWANHHLDQPDAALARLKPLAEPTNAWHALAMEAQAWVALSRGAKADAETTLRGLAADVTAPEGVRTRATELLGRLSG